MERQSAHSPHVSIVVPVYCSEKILPRLVDEVYAVMQGKGLHDSFELVLVNDASPDCSWEQIKRLAGVYKFIVGLSLMKNFGQHNAIMAGLNHASGDVVVIMDDDLQHPPTTIPTLLDTIDSGADVCYTYYRDRRHKTWKKIGSWINDVAATVLLGKPRKLYLSSFKALRRSVVNEIIKYDGPYAYVDGLILDITRSIASVEIQHGERFEGTGNYTFRKSLSLWLKMATSFSVFPLRLASFIGISLAGLSFVLIAAVVVEKLRHPETPAGWSSLIATVLLIGGIQFLCIGLVGEYLGRAYLKLNRKPQFIVRETYAGTSQRHLK